MHLPRENPYVGCGRTRNRSRLAYLDRSRSRPGMVTPAVVKAFRSIGWAWGGSWTGSTKDYMHFSVNGHSPGPPTSLATGDAAMSVGGFADDEVQRRKGADPHWV